MSKQNWLIVDDSKAMRLIVRRTLRQVGFDTTESFQDALAPFAA